MTTTTARVPLSDLLRFVIPLDAVPGQLNPIDQEFVAGMTCSHCGATEMLYIAYRSPRSYYAVACCAACGHAEVF